MKQSVLRSLLLSSLLCATALLVSCAEQNKTDKPENEAAKANVHWDKITGLSKTTPTLQVVVNPPLRRGSKIHDNAFQSLRDLQADYVRSFRGCLTQGSVWRNWNVR